MCRSTGLCLVNQTRLHMISLNKADEDTVEKINIKKTYSFQCRVCLGSKWQFRLTGRWRLFP